jgi:hypothetical protein
MALEIGLKVVIIPHRLLQDVAEVCLLQANWGEFTRPPIIAIVINPRSIICYTILNIIFPNTRWLYLKNIRYPQKKFG